MATYNQTTSGGVGGDGSAVAAFTAGTDRAAFLARYDIGDTVYVRKAGGTYRRVRVTQYIDNVWGDGYFLASGETVVYGDGAISPSEYADQLRVGDNIDTREVYRKFHNALS
jgi:hypothetical protein